MKNTFYSILIEYASELDEFCFVFCVLPDWQKRKGAKQLRNFHFFSWISTQADRCELFQLASCFFLSSVLMNVCFSCIQNGQMTFLTKANARAAYIGFGSRLNWFLSGNSNPRVNCHAFDVDLENSSNVSFVTVISIWIKMLDKMKSQKKMKIRRAHANGYVVHSIELHIQNVRY